MGLFNLPSYWKVRYISFYIKKINERTLTSNIVQIDLGAFMVQTLVNDVGKGEGKHKAHSVQNDPQRGPTSFVCSQHIEFTSVWLNG